MNIGKRAVINGIFWLLPGLAAGVILAAVLSWHEYRTVAGIAGLVVEADAAGGNDSFLSEPDSSVQDQSSGGNRNGDTLSDAFARSLKGNTEDGGEAFLEAFGYRPMRNWGSYLPFAVIIAVLLFQLAGFITFRIWWREIRRVKNRTLELTEYLRAVNAGEGAVLCRNEDEFSHLEDEIYKTVMRLQSTKEDAVKNHEVLAERIADIAHQLKTPLTSMSLMTELLLEYQTVETEEYLSRLAGQIERLKNLVSGLLSLAKLDSHGILFHRERLFLTELLESVQESLREMLSKRQITLTIEGGGSENVGCCIYADRQWTEEALLNVLKNCAEHTPDEGRITASCTQNPIYTELRIEDGGNGFAAKDLPHIFERFYRGEGAGKDNAGIGLALAKAVLEEQNGYLYAENTADGHACFRMKWYA